MAKSRASRSKYRVGNTVEIKGTTRYETVTGIVTAVIPKLYSLPDRVQLATFMYRVTVANGRDGFSNSTRFLHEYQIVGKVASKPMAQEAA